MDNINFKLMDIIKNYRKYDFCTFEKRFFLKSDITILPILIFYCYKNREYLKCITYCKKHNKEDFTMVYNCLSLYEKGYKDESFRLFNKYKEKFIDFLNFEVINEDIIKLFILFLDKDLKKYINFIKENFYKRIYISFIKIEANEELEENLKFLKEIIYSEKEEEVKKYAFRILEKYIAVKERERRNFQWEKERIILNEDSTVLKKLDYCDEECSIVSYKSSYMMNMHILEYRNNIIIVDSGAAIDIDGRLITIDIEEFFKENNISINCIQGILLTHAHLDHYGSLEKFNEYGIKIFMTEETRDLIKITNKEFDLKNVNIIYPLEEFQLGRFQIVPYINGHILGSVAYIIKAGDKKIMFTGDFCLNNQWTINGMSVKDKNDIDVLVMETTYGDKCFSLTYDDKMESIKELVMASLKYGIQTIIPAFAIGRAQELVKILEELSEKYKILIDGSAGEVTKYYMDNTELYLNKNIEIGSIYSISENLKCFDIIIASSGMLNKGSKSEQYLKKIRKNLETTYTILKVGYIPGYNEELKSLNFYDGININFFEIGISAHATYNQLIYTVNQIKPKVLVQVHGEGII